MPTQQTWEEHARNWIAWARTPGHDIFPYFAPQFFDEIVPPPHGRTLEIGCGEGRMMRQLTSRGHAAIGIDASRTLVGAAIDEDAASAYALADATALPFTDAAFETVIAYNSLQTMAAWGDMARTVRESGRVLRPSGYLCLCVAHPVTDVDRTNSSGGADGASSDSYFERQHVNDTVVTNGLEMTFTGWTYTLGDYARALEDAGFIIERMREPAPSAEDAAERPQLERWRRVPLFLTIRARRRP